MFRVILHEFREPERLAGSLWGIIIVVSVVGSVGIATDARTEGLSTVLLAGASAAAAWSVVEGTISVFEGFLIAGSRRESVDGRKVAARALAATAVQLAGAIPVLLPLILIPSYTVALRVSNVMALLLLFAIGWRAGSLAHGSRWTWAIVLTAAGAALVVFIIALGG